METVKELRNEVSRLKGSRDSIKKQMKSAKARIDALKQEIQVYEEARELIRHAAIKTQEQLQYQISDITTVAMNAVFDDPYEVSIEFVQRRNQTECDIYFVRGEDKVNPLDASGGGAVDVAAFALRVASWAMPESRTMPVIVMDEPFRFLDKERQHRAADMIQELSSRLGVQFIIVTHEEALTEGADEIFNVDMVKGKSKVVGL